MTKHKMCAYSLVLIILVLTMSGFLSAQPTTNVKVGDWIEYQVTFTGTPPPDHLIIFARMEILDVSGPMIHVNINSTYANGTQEVIQSTLNLQTGQLIDDFIIPSNLKTGDSFYDSRVGNITISSTEQRNYAGAERTVISATSLSNTYVWDQATGVSVEGISIEADYTMHSIVTATNMWNPSDGLNRVIMYAFIVVVAIIIVDLVLLFLTRKHKKSKVNLPVN
ncbi:MAG: hypothetical protein FWG55_08050 [Candidatus Bathyarchaeota archaeon]|nr:hypothetical protein [Candidatus Termiticorpusculum sp.]